MAPRRARTPATHLDGVSAPSTSPAPPARPARGRRSGQRSCSRHGVTNSHSLTLSVRLRQEGHSRGRARIRPRPRRRRALRVPPPGTGAALGELPAIEVQSRLERRRAYRIRRRSSGEEADYRDGDSPVTLRASARVAPAVRDREQRESSRAAMIAPGFHVTMPPRQPRLASLYVRGCPLPSLRISITPGCRECAALGYRRDARRGDPTARSPHGCQGSSRITRKWRDYRRVYRHDRCQVGDDEHDTIPRSRRAAAETRPLHSRPTVVEPEPGANRRFHAPPEASFRDCQRQSKSERQSPSRNLNASWLVSNANGNGRERRCASDPRAVRLCHASVATWTAGGRPRTETTGYHDSRVAMIATRFRAQLALRAPTARDWLALCSRGLA